jgi:hypothetical protein
LTKHQTMVSVTSWFQCVHYLCEPVGKCVFQLDHRQNHHALQLPLSAPLTFPQPYLCIPKGTALTHTLGYLVPLHYRCLPMASIMDGSSPSMAPDSRMNHGCYTCAPSGIGHP